mgnify:CR=1 FL=1
MRAITLDFKESHHERTLPYKRTDPRVFHGTFSGGAVSSNGGKISAKCKVTVSDTVAVSSITLKDQSVRIAEGKTFQLEAEVLPENATNKKVNWTSSDETAATVDQNGLVTGIAAGTTVITAVTQDGGRQVTCTVSVTKDKTTEYEVQRV